jgi:hypothetical protein
MPKDVTETLLSDVRQYFSAHPFKGFPSNADKKVKRQFAFYPAGC